MMRVDLDAKVLTRDGGTVGSVQRAVVDPGTNELTHLVIGTGGLFGHDVLLPRGEIDRASRDGDRILLDLDGPAVESLEPYLPTHYVVPPAGWAYPGAYSFGAYGGFVWPAAYAGYTPAGGELRRTPGQPAMASIGKSAVVVDVNGDDVGVVEDVFFDERTGELRGFVLRAGGVLRTVLGGGERLRLMGAAIDRVEEGLVRLRVPKEDIERVARDP